MKEIRSEWLPLIFGTTSAEFGPCIFMRMRKYNQHHETPWETDRRLQWEGKGQILGEGNKAEAYLLAHEKSQEPFNTKTGADLLGKSRVVCSFEPWLLVEEACGSSVWGGFRFVSKVAGNAGGLAGYLDFHKPFPCQQRQGANPTCPSRYLQWYYLYTVVSFEGSFAVSDRVFPFTNCTSDTKLRGYGTSLADEKRGKFQNRERWRDLTSVPSARNQAKPKGSKFQILSSFC